jgi:hypothetical protein
MAHKEHVTETPDTSYIKNVDVTHEASDVYVGGIAKFVVALAILMVVSFILMWALFVSLEKTAKDPPRSPMAEDRLPPEPRLQSAQEKEAEPGHERKAAAPAPKDPLWEINVLRKHWDDVLENGPVDKDGKRFGMPIEKAKEEVLKQLPVREQKATK